MFQDWTIERARVFGKELSIRTITSVHSNKKVEIDKLKLLAFKFKECPTSFYLETYFLNGEWKPNMVYHMGSEEKGQDILCLLCHEKDKMRTLCSFFNPYSEEVFQKVMLSDIFRYLAFSEYPKLGK